MPLLPAWLYPPTDPDKRADYWRIATVVVGVVGILVAIGGTIYAVVDARDNAHRIEEAVRAKNQAEQQLATERARNREIGNLNLEKFLYDYNALLANLKQA